MREATVQDYERVILTSIRDSVDSPVMYDLGCGQTPEPGMVGLDLYANADRVKRADLYSFPWKVDGEVIPDESVDYLTAVHFLEHIPDWDAHFTEVYRILKPGGHYKILAPYAYSSRHDQDPDHKQKIFEKRFVYLSQEWLRREKQEHNRPRINFEVKDGQFFFCLHPDYIGKSEAAIAFAKEHYFNVITDIGLFLVKLPMPEGA